MNIITDPASNERGGKFKQEGGSGGFLENNFELQFRFDVTIS